MRGVYLNPGDSMFRESVNSEIYVDKSGLIAATNSFADTERKFMCVSRTRRFGKTMALKMLAAYYSKNADGTVFAKLKIAGHASFSKHLGKYNCLLLDIGDFYDNAESPAKLFAEMASAVREEFREQFPDVAFDDKDGVAKCMRRVYKKTGERFVVPIDEYDVLVREQVSAAVFDKYLKFLNGLFKSSSVSGAIALAYVTGIFPVVRDKFQSKLNNFWEYTMLRPLELAEYAGFTFDEVESLCARYGVNASECRKWFDGYRLGGMDIYAPLSVVRAVTSGTFASYWNATSSFEALKGYITRNFSGLADDVNALIAGGDVPVDTGTFENKMKFACKDDVLTYCIHLGYLGYNEDTGTCRIPNYEVRDEWVRTVRLSDEYRNSWEIIKSSEALLDATVNGDAAMVADLLGKAHRKLVDSLNYNREESLRLVVMMAYLYAREHYTVIQELPAGDGFADVAFVPYYPADGRPALIVELNVDAAAATGLEQMKGKNYPAGLEKYHDNMLLVAVSYNRKTREHRCVIERA